MKITTTLGGGDASDWARESPLGNQHNPQQKTKHKEIYRIRIVTDVAKKGFQYDNLADAASDFMSIAVDDAKTTLGLGFKQELGTQQVA